ncbi:hypothetical protein [Accumulibacter sp.]|uniref:hypothetical protein n=1 Tax=Accumulibacter sp. TaxID=2053492 RepID=UPI0025FDE2B3|nr:hypothetical protein [Accumulibacter sp.]MCM8594983.1 hypothetical protein [Accumulibacter sp.]MCM8625622.1 hypothetical protein [Accumulibacter sp.]MDS4049129.1 hypothetical protein [Accumulibacter sp.]
MKTTARSLCIGLSLALGTATPALADRGHHHGYYGPVQPYAHHGGDFRPARPYAYYPAPQYKRSWVGPAAVLAIAGIATGVAIASATPAPRPVVVAPAPVPYVAPPAGFWQYCASAASYYPYVPYCPEGWQLVPVR